MKILAIFIIWSLYLSLEFLLGPFSHVRIHDSGDGLLPQLLASKIQFQKYGLSYFGDYMASGIDAATQLLVPFSNLNSLLFIIFPGWFAYGLLMFMQRFFASYFLYRLSRDSLKLQVIPSIIAGILYSLFNFSIFSFTLYHQLGLPALPFILWSLEKIFQKQKTQKYIFLVFFSVFVGYSTYFAHFTPFLFIFILIWFIYLKNIYNSDVILSLLIFITILLIVQSQDIFSLIANAPFSHRTSWNLSSETFHPGGPIVSALNLTKNTILSNIVSIAIISLIIILRKKKVRNFKKLISLLTLLIILPGIYRIIQPSISKSLGSIGSFPIYRVEMFVPFVFSITAALSLESLSKIKNKEVFLGVTIIIAAILIASSINLKIQTVANYAPYRNLYLHPDLTLLAGNIDNSNWRVATITGGGFRPSYALAYGLHSVDTYVNLYPNAYHRFWSEIISDRIKNDKSKYEDFIDWGNRIYLYGPENFADPQPVNFREYYNLELLSTASVKYIIANKQIENENLILLPSEYRQKLQDWNLWSKVKKLKFFLSGQYYGAPLFIYENRKALPRFRIEKDGKLLSAALRTILYAPDKIEINILAPKGSDFVAAINYYPSWKITVNSKAVAVDKYHGTFMKINLDKENSLVILEYLPPYKLF